MRKLADISAFERLQGNADGGFVADVSVFNGPITDQVWKQYSGYLSDIHSLPRKKYLERLRLSYSGSTPEMNDTGATALAAALGKAIFVHTYGQMKNSQEVDHILREHGIETAEDYNEKYYGLVESLESQYMLDHTEECKERIFKECIDAAEKFAPFFDDVTQGFVQVCMHQSALYWLDKCLERDKNIILDQEEMEKYYKDLEEEEQAELEEIKKYYKDLEEEEQAELKEKKEDDLWAIQEELERG